MARLTVGIVVICIILAIRSIWLNAIEPEVGIELALAQVNGNEAAAAAMRSWGDIRTAVNVLSSVIVAITVIVLCYKPLISYLRKGNR